MRMFMWDVQYFCPLSCVYCYSNSGPTMPQVSAEQLWRVARAIAREKPDAVMISGGEPALAKGIDEIGEYFKKRGIVASIFTSGWGLDEKRVARITAAFNRIHVSLDAADPATNDRIRGKIGAHRNAIETLRLLSRQKSLHRDLRFGVDCMVVKSNLERVVDLCDLVTSIDGIDFLNIAPAVPTGRASQPGFSLLLDEEQIASLLSQAATIRAKMPRSISLSIHRNEFLQADDEQAIQVNSSGDVRAIKICEQTVGNLVDERLEDIVKRASQWRAQSELAQSLRAARDFVSWADVVRRIDSQAKGPGGGRS